MIKSIEMSGRNEDAAIAAALAELGMDRDDVSVEILQRSKSGFLGIGSAPAIIRVSYEVPDEPKKADRPNNKKHNSKNKNANPEKADAQAKAEPEKAPKPAQKKGETKAKAEAPKTEKAAAVKAEAPAKAKKAAPKDEAAEYAEIRSFLEGLFEKMGAQADIEIGPSENGGVNVTLSGDGMGAIIGRRGETLDAIQHLTNYVCSHGNDKRAHINIDAEEYRAKREESLVHLAEKMAEKAIKYKRSMALEPMNSYERHVIHTALQNYEGVTTASTGEEPNRRVVVNYVKSDKDEPSNKPKVKEWA